MRYLIMLAVSTSLGCSLGTHIYDGCAPEQEETLTCALGCPGGGVGCAEVVELAARCSGPGGLVWREAFPCGACSVFDGGGEVACDGEAVPLSQLLAACSEGAVACSADRASVLECLDDRYVIRDECPDGAACGTLPDGGIGCR